MPRPGFVIPILLVLAGCDYVFDVSPGIPEPEPPSFQPVRVGTLGTWWRAGERTVIIYAEESGRFTCRRDEYEGDDLENLLLRHAEGKRDPHHPHPSLVQVLVEADGSVPWRVTREVLRACASAEVRIYRVLFLAIDEDTGRAGAISAFLPRSFRPWVRDPLSRLVPEGPVVTLHGAGGLRRDRAALHHAVSSLPDAEKEKTLVIEADGGVPTRAVLMALDTVVRAGVRSAVLSAADPEPSKGQASDLLLRGEPLPPAPAGHRVPRISEFIEDGQTGVVDVPEMRVNPPRPLLEDWK
ncbi:MAG: ExbD/TolR family protein [Planctomycetota bacterium]